MKDITKPRLLYIYSYLVNGSSENHAVSKRDIMNMLQEKHALSVNRVTLINDIKMLMEAGVPIRIIPQGRKYTYYYDGRELDKEDLNILADVVASSSLLSKSKKQTLTGKLEKLAAPYEPFEKKRNVTAPYSNLIPIIDVINEAINRKLQISFYSVEYAIGKDRIQRKKGEHFVVSPYSLEWDAGACFVVCLCEGELQRVRLDWMYRTPEILEEEIVPMPEQSSMEATVLCNNNVLDSLVAHFGTDIKVSPAGEGQFRAVMMTSENFYYWVNDWEESVQIVSPEEAVREYRKFCEELAD